VSILHKAFSVHASSPVDESKDSSKEDSRKATQGYWHWSVADNAPWKVEALKLACEVSDCNLDFIRKITAENGHMAHDAQSTIPRSGYGSLNGYEDSWGYCQMYRPAQAKYLEDPRFFTDKKWQMNLCYEKWKSGTPMYAKPTPKEQFKFITYS